MKKFFFFSFAVLASIANAEPKETSLEVRAKFDELALSWEQIIAKRYLDPQEGLLIKAHAVAGDKIAAIKNGLKAQENGDPLREIKEFIGKKKAKRIGGFAGEPNGDIFLGEIEDVLWAMEHFHEVMQNRMEQKIDAISAHHADGKKRMEEGRFKLMYSSSIGADSYIPKELQGEKTPGNSGSGLVTLQHAVNFSRLLGPDCVHVILDTYFGSAVGEHLGKCFNVPSSIFHERVHKAQKGSCLEHLQDGQDLDVLMAIIPYTSDPGYLGGIAGLFPEVSREERALYYQMIYLHFLEQYAHFLPDVIMVSHASHIPPLAMAAAAAFGIRPAVVPVLHGTEEAAMHASLQKYDGSLAREWTGPLMEVDAFSAITVQEAEKILARIERGARITEVIPNGVDTENFQVRDLHFDVEQKWIEDRMQKVGYERVFDGIASRVSPAQVENLRLLPQEQLLDACKEFCSPEELKAFRDLMTGGIPKDVERVFVVVGKYIELKGIHPLMDAVAKVNQNALEKILLLIMGSGSDLEKQRLVEHVVQRDLGSHVGFLGFITDRVKQSEVMQFCAEFRKGGGLVVASDHEPFGLTPFEAMASGSKVFWPTSCGGLSAVLRNNACMSEEELIQAMERTGLGYAFKAYRGNAGRDSSIQDPDWGYRDSNGRYIGGTYSDRIAEALHGSF